MVKREYARSDYDADKHLIERLNSAKHSDVVSKLEALMDIPEDGKSKALYIGHSETNLKFLSMDSAYNALENPAYLASIILRRTEHLSGDSLKIFSDEIVSSINKRVEELFGQRYRGAVKRVKKYERDLAAPFLKDLRSALRSKNPDKIYCAAERICIQTENFPSNHPILTAYVELKPKIEEILK